MTSNMSREDGFTITEMLVSVTIMLVVTGAALTTFQNALAVTDSASQLADANQNLRAGTNQLIRDVMMAGRIIGAEGIAMPTGGTQTFLRPGPPGSSLTFNLVADDPPDTTLNLPSITTGSGLGPLINGKTTDIVTIMTVDEFMPVITSPAYPAVASTSLEGNIANDGRSVTLPTNSVWLTGDPVADTPKIEVGDLVFFKGPLGNAIQTVTRKDATHIYFDASSAYDWFRFNQPSATSWPMWVMKGSTDATTNWNQTISMFKALMITYYVDNVTKPGTPRLTRLINHCPSTLTTCPDLPMFEPQALAGVVEDLELTYDLVDGVNNPVNVVSLPYTEGTDTYNSNQIRKVNIHVGVRSEVLSKPAQDYVRNHISTSVDVRSLASVDRYKTQ